MLSGALKTSLIDTAHLSLYLYESNIRIGKISKSKSENFLATDFEFLDVTDIFSFFIYERSCLKLENAYVKIFH